ncbi:hypothetical protein BYT27DRAFT_7085176 [Phlegmacium glaucopus]|nr:hypothetical protein BYT27DRAFT_7085176 [Phlegmacium glaucopus]
MPPTPFTYNPQYSGSPYASVSRPPVGTVLYDKVYNEDLLAIKVQLRSMLRDNRLSNMPMGFPFRSVFDGHGRYRISRESYEFQERFCFSDQRSRTHTATISYTAPSSNAQHLSWRISVPSRESSLNGNLPSRISFAQVEVDRIVLETPHGMALMSNPQIILRALSISMEMGILVSVSVANCKTPVYHPVDQRLDYSPGDVIYVATDNNHRSEVVLVFKT